MTALRWPARLYWAGIVLGALGLFAFAWTGGGRVDQQSQALALAFTGLVLLAKLFPLHVAPKTKVTLDTAVLFAAMLLLGPVPAMAVAAVGTLAAHLIRREEWFQALFNGAQAMLRTGVGALLLALAGWSLDSLTSARPEHLAMPVVAAGAMYAMDRLVVATMVALHLDRSLVRSWREAFGLAGREECAQLGLGLLVAAVVDVHPWALPLFVFPAYVIYRSLERHVQLRQQTVDAVEALVGIVGGRDRYTAAQARQLATFARELRG